MANGMIRGYGPAVQQQPPTAQEEAVKTLQDMGINPEGEEMRTFKAATTHLVERDDDMYVNPLLGGMQVAEVNDSLLQERVASDNREREMDPKLFAEQAQATLSNPESRAALKQTYYRKKVVKKIQVDEKYKSSQPANVPITAKARKAQEVIDSYGVKTRRAKSTASSKETEAYKAAQKVKQSGYTIGGFDLKWGSASDRTKILDMLTLEANEQNIRKTLTKPITLQMIADIRAGSTQTGKAAKDFMTRKGVDFELTDSALDNIVEIALPSYERKVKNVLGATIFAELDTASKTAIVALTWLNEGKDAMGLVKTYRNDPTDVNYAAMIKEYEKDYWEKDDKGVYKTTPHNAQRTQDVADALRSAYGAKHQ